ncbi:hypothetical protein [Nostoc sp. C110]|uniref:hypothetical protein n=1 Tax=Nostoc sp. C110 TaxID=3349876 RepID=UPI00370D5B5E
MKNIVIPIFLIGLSLASCAATSLQDLAKSHLELIKAGKSSEANQQYCMTKESLRLHSVKGFEILSSQSKTQNGLSYTEILTKLDTEQTVYKNIEENGIAAPRKQSIQQVNLEVWKSDDFYNRIVSETAKLNDFSQKIGSNQKQLPVPNRSEVNSNSLCVFLDFEQFESDKL